MALLAVTQDPGELLDYGWDWRDADNDDRVLEADETISTSQWFVFDSDQVTPNVEATIDDPSDSKTDTETLVWVSTLVLGRDYVMTNRILTSKGRIYERSFKIKCRNR